MILAVDLGNFNIKSSEQVIFSSKFIEGGNNNIIGDETLEFNGKFYTMQKGEYENKFNKAEKNYLPNLLYCIGKSVSYRQREIKLILGTPLDNKDIGNKLKNDLCGQRFEFKVNGVEYDIFISKVGVISEGFSSFYTLNKADREKDSLIIDIGGRTVNVVSFVNGKVEHKITITKGMLNFYDDIKTRLNAGGMNYDINEVERLIKNNMLKIDEDMEIFFKDIMNQIEFKLKHNIYINWFTGGGSIVLQDTIMQLLPNAKFIPNPLFSNSLGNKRIAEIKWS